MYTSHGHQIPGTPVEGERSLVARCGGPRLCYTCSAQVDYQKATNTLIHTHEDNPMIGTKMELTTFVRRPFTVEAIEITEENIDAIAEHVGTLSTKPDGTKFIQVDRKKVPNIFRVFPGFWMTKMGDNVRCYSEKIFKEQFIGMTPEIQDWTDYLNDAGRVETLSDSDELPQPEAETRNVFEDQPAQPTSFLG